MPKFKVGDTVYIAACEINRPIAAKIKEVEKKSKYHSMPIYILLLDNGRERRETELNLLTYEQASKIVRENVLNLAQTAAINTVQAYKQAKTQEAIFNEYAQILLNGNIPDIDFSTSSVDEIMKNFDKN